MLLGLIRPIIMLIIICIDQPISTKYMHHFTVQRHIAVSMAGNSRLINRQALMDYGLKDLVKGWVLG